MARFDGEVGSLLEDGWSLDGADGEGRAVRLVFGDTELTRAYLGLTIGRHPKLCERVVDDTTVSRRHLRVGVREAELFAEDVNSLNGTLLDGQRLTPFQAVRVRSGQRLTLGRLVLVVRRISEHSPRPA